MVCIKTLDEIQSELNINNSVDEKLKIFNTINPIKKLRNFNNSFIDILHTFHKYSSDVIYDNINLTEVERNIKNCLKHHKIFMPIKQFTVHEVDLQALKHILKKSSYTVIDNYIYLKHGYPEGLENLLLKFKNREEYKSVIKSSIISLFLIFLISFFSCISINTDIITRIFVIVVSSYFLFKKVSIIFKFMLDKLSKIQRIN